MITIIATLALSVLLGTLTWRVIDIGLEKIQARTEGLKKQGELLDRFYDMTAKFLKETNDTEHAQLRDTLCSMPLAIKQGQLAEIFLERKINGREKTNDKLQQELDKEFAALGEERMHLFGRALGTAILASTYGLGSRGPFVRSWIYALMGGPRIEVAYPKEMTIQIRPMMQNQMPDFVAA